MELVVKRADLEQITRERLFVVLWNTLLMCWRYRQWQVF